VLLQVKSEQTIDIAHVRQDVGALNFGGKGARWLRSRRTG